MTHEGKFKRSRKLWMLGAATFLTPLMMPAIAQAADADAAQPAGGLGEIVVTATHKSESIQKVAISLQALSPEKLEQHQISTFADYVQMLPSVSFSSLGPGRSVPYFRGITAAGGQAATVGVYLDDVPVTTAGRMPDVHIYDVERVEALSGPQGTLFGSSSLAGTLRIITNKAKIGKFEAGYDVQVNKYGKGDFGQMAEGFVNIPVNEKLAVRLVGYYKHDGGYIDNTPASLTYNSINYTKTNNAIAKKDYNPVYEFGGRASATVQVNQDWTITPEITYQNLNAKGGFLFDPKAGDLAVHDYSDTYNKDQWYQAALTIQGKIADFDVVSATGYFSRKIRNANDYTYYTVTYDKTAAANPSYLNYMKFTDKTTGQTIDPTQKYYGYISQKKFTQELRVSVPKSWPFAMTVGGFYQYQKSSTDSNYYIDGLSNATGYGQWASFSPALPGTVNANSLYLVENDLHYKDGAVFAEASYDILHNLKITGGGRYFISDNGTLGFSGEQPQAAAAGCWNDATHTFIYPSRLSCINTSAHFHQTGETHKASLSWQIDPSKMVYFTYSTGFRPGGGNRSGRPNYTADTLSNFEVGFKTRWGSNFRLNGAAYYEKWSNMQYAVVIPGTQGSTMNLNAGAARVLGVELDGELRLGKLSLSASGSYNDAKVTTDICAVNKSDSYNLYTDCSTNPAHLVAPKGTRLPRQPRLKMQATARYETPVGSYDGFVQGTVFYQTNSTSEIYTLDNTLLGNTGAFASFDFSAGIKKDKWSLEAFIQNAFDNRGILSKNSFCSIEMCAGSARSLPIKPQFFGLKFGQKF